MSRQLVKNTVNSRCDNMFASCTRTKTDIETDTGRIFMNIKQNVPGSLNFVHICILCYLYSNSTRVFPLFVEKWKWNFRIPHVNSTQCVGLPVYVHLWNFDNSVFSDTQTTDIFACTSNGWHVGNAKKIEICQWHISEKKEKRNFIIILVKI